MKIKKPVVGGGEGEGGRLGKKPWRGKMGSTLPLFGKGRGADDKIGPIGGGRASHKKPGTHQGGRT